MLLNLRELELRKVRFDTACPGGKLDLEGSNFHARSEIRISGSAELIAGTEEIRVRGHISGELEGECDRCLDTAPYPIDRDFELFYRPVKKDEERVEMEVERSEIEVGYYEGEGLDLATVLREQIMLWLPMHWTCSEDCRGICPVCGVNRNRESCNCRQDEQDDRWAGLRNFRPSKPS